jgi:hypothetical protein
MGRRQIRRQAGADGCASVCDLGTTWSRLHFVTALPTTGNVEKADGACSKYAFGETNSPVKWRFMNGLEDRGCEFGKDRLGKQLGARTFRRGDVSSFAKAVADSLKAKDPPIRFCETNPICFDQKLGLMWLNDKRLRRWDEAKEFGFVLENEPNFRGYLRSFSPKSGFGLGVTDDHVRRHGQSRICREDVAPTLQGQSPRPGKDVEKGAGVCHNMDIARGGAVAALGGLSTVHGKRGQNTCEYFGYGCVESGA